MKKLIFIIVIFSSICEASRYNCKFMEWVQKNELAENQDFWVDYANYASKGGDASDIDELAKIAARRLGKSADEIKAEVTRPAQALSAPSTTPLSPPTQSLTRTTIRRNAIKSYEDLPPVAQAKFDEAVKIFDESGFNGAMTRFRQGKWNPEYVHNEGFYAIRLDGGNRLAFKQLSDGSVQIWDAGAVYKH